MEKVLVQALVEKGIKERAEKVLQSMGLSNSVAVRMFLTQVAAQGKIPFEIVEDKKRFKLEAMDSKYNRDNELI